MYDYATAHSRQISRALHSNNTDLRLSIMEIRQNSINNNVTESDPIFMELEPTVLHNESIAAHIIFEVDDKPWTLMHTLECFKVISVFGLLIISITFMVSYIFESVMSTQY